jgi:hypothetical protein
MSVITCLTTVLRQLSLSNDEVNENSKRLSYTISLFSEEIVNLLTNELMEPSP